jgi:hypothetical protein
MSKKPSVPLTRSSIEAEINRIHREVVSSLVKNPKRVKALKAELKELLEYVERNEDKIVRD